uniref:MFS domain-containing protein n=1 Tax=Panagrellus redivivus TaxID=6233 RepID=A0A7E4UQU6_PANRE
MQPSPIQTLNGGTPRKKISRQVSFFHPFSRRLHVMLLLMTGFFLASYMRSNLGMTMTCIVNTTAVAIETAQNHIDANLTLRDQSIPLQCQREGLAEEGVPINDYGGTLIWGQTIQNMLFAGSFGGSLVTVIPAGYLADRTSPMNLYQTSILTYVVCTALFPVLAKYTSHYIVFLSRFIMGLGEALIIPAANAIITRWVPNQEKSTAAAIFTAGNQFAGVLGIPIAASFCASSYGWPAVFYFAAFLGVVWSVVFRLCVSNTPDKANNMSKEERNFLEENIEKVMPTATRRQQKVPWSKLLTSPAVIACFVAISSQNMVVVLLQAYQPTYMKEVLYLKLVDNGLYSAVPYVIQIIAKMIWSMTFDYLKASKRITNTMSCKISQSFASFTMGLFLFLIPQFTHCESPGIVVVLFCLVGFGFAAAICGFYTSMLSLAPAYIGIISSFAQFVGFVSMLVPPILVNYFRVYGTLEEWTKIFNIIAGYTVFGGVFFLIFGHGEALPWGRHSQTSDTDGDEALTVFSERRMTNIEVTLDQ